MWLSLAVAVQPALASSCDTGGGYDGDPMVPSSCDVIAVTPGDGDATVEGGQLVVMTTDGCEELKARAGGVDALPLVSWDRVTRPPTAHEATWRYSLAGLPKDETIFFLRNGGVEGVLTVDIGLGERGELVGEASVDRVEENTRTYSNEPCGGGWTTTWVWVEWTAPAATAPGWTARLVDEEGRFVVERPLGATPDASKTLTEGREGEGSRCFSVEIVDPMGEVVERTRCAGPSPLCGVRGGPGRSLGLAGLSAVLLLVTGRRRRACGRSAPPSTSEPPCASSPPSPSSSPSP